MYGASNAKCKPKPFRLHSWPVLIMTAHVSFLIFFPYLFIYLFPSSFGVSRLVQFLDLTWRPHQDFGVWSL